MSWLPGTHSAVPAATMSMPAQHAGRCRARGRRGRRGRPPCGPRGGVPRRGRPGGPRRPPRRSRACSSSSTSSSQQPCTSPMMSNGPCSSRRSFHSGWRSISPPRPPRARARRRAEALALQARSERRSCDALLPDHVRAEVAVRPLPVALVAELLGQVEHDRDRQAVVLRASATSGLRPRAARWWRRPPSAARAPAACAAMKCSTSNASFVAPGRSRRRTPARQKSDESTSVGRKCLRANVTCPSPTGRSARRGRARGSSSSSREHRHLRRRAHLGILRADRRNSTV
jgi:hypothetical protein